MKRASDILSTIGLLLDVLLLIASGSMAALFGLLAQSETIFASSSLGGIALGYVCMGISIVYATLVLISLLFCFFGRLAVADNPVERKGFVGHIVAGALALNVLLLLSGTMGLRAQNEGKNTANKKDRTK